jgi:signal transduction histidine kinase
MAGWRFLAQELMLCFWILMVLCLVFIAFISEDQHRFRVRFAYAFSFLWLLAMATAGFIAFACAAPFDLLCARIGDDSVFANVVHAILLLELGLVLISPIVFIIWRKLRKGKT